MILQAVFVFDLLEVEGLKSEFCYWNVFIAWKCMIMIVFWQPVYYLSCLNCLFDRQSNSWIWWELMDSVICDWLGSHLFVAMGFHLKCMYFVKNKYKYWILKNSLINSQSVLNKCSHNFLLFGVGYGVKIALPFTSADTQHMAISVEWI